MRPFFESSVSTYAHDVTVKLCASASLGMYMVLVSIDGVEHSMLNHPVSDDCNFKQVCRDLAKRIWSEQSF